MSGPAGDGCIAYSTLLLRLRSSERRVGLRAMRLVSARLKNFRLFEDTGEVPLGQITVLLAQNENGKTAFLQGLAWFSEENVEELDEEDRWQGATGLGGEVVSLP